MMTMPSEETVHADDDGLASVAALAPQAVIPKEFEARYIQSLASWSESISPQGEFQRFHLGQAVLASIRVENCQVAEIKRRIKLAEIATDPGPRWDRNRSYEAIHLSDSLKRNPTKVAMELQRTHSGREWMLIQWNNLFHAVAEVDGSLWNEGLTEEAFDLMGISKAHRAVMPDVRKIFGDLKATRDLILSNIKMLRELQETLIAEHDELRELHRQGIGLENDKYLKQIRCYEADAQRLLNRSLKTVKQAQSGVIKPQPKPATVKPNPTPVPTAPETKVEPAAKAEAPVGNRLHRRKLEASARREAHRARKSR